MKKLFLNLFFLLSLISLFGCFNDKQEKDSNELKVLKNGSVTELYSVSTLDGVEVEIKGILNKNEIDVNPDFLSIIKHKDGNTILSIASLSNASANTKLFSVKSTKFDFNTLATYSNNSKSVSKAIAPIWEAKKCDFDSNKIIDLKDFISFSDSYGTEYKPLVSENISFDLNGDYSVNLADLVIFARNYGNMIDSVDNIEFLRDVSLFEYYALENLSGIEFSISSAVSSDNITTDSSTLKIVKENNGGTILALAGNNKVFLKGSKIFLIINCYYPLNITTTKKIPVSSTYEVINLPVKTHEKAGNYILKDYSDWSEVCGDLLSKTDIASLDFINYDYIAMFAGAKPNSGYGFTISSFVESENAISITTAESVFSGITLQVITYPHIVIKIPKTSKKIVFTSTSQQFVPKLNIKTQSLTSATGTVSVFSEGQEGRAYNFSDVINQKTIVPLSSGISYTVVINLTGYSSYSRQFNLQGGDKYIYLKELTPIQDGIFFNNNGVLTAAVSTADNITNAKTYNYQSTNSGKLSLDIYSNKSLVMSKSIDVLPLKNYQFIYYNYGEGSNENKVEAFETDNKIKLDIYSNGWGTLIGRKYLDEGSHSVSVYELTPYSGGNNYFGYAAKDGYYTKVYNWTTSPIDLKLDPVENDTNVHGAFFFDEGFFADSPIDNTTITVSKNGVILNSFKTDENGKYSFAFIPGTYDISFNYEEFLYNKSITITNKYHDFIIPCQIQAKKPNIYLYPTKTTKMNVTLDFPNGGKVVESIPDYGTGWNNITVEPNGKINGKYTYLFYESDSNDFSQYSEGWIVKRENLELFFRKNMYDYGFRGQEIEDFIEYWIPLLKDSSSYAVYPQLDKDISKEVVLNISQKPDSLLRLIYTVKPCNSMLNLKTPVIPAFARKGFTVTEWGVVMK